LESYEYHASMNRIYRLVWSAVREVWIPAAENARGRGKRVSRMLSATLTTATLALGSAYALAGIPATGPSGGVITTGCGSITQSATLTTITQASPRLSLTWNTFNISAHDTVDFVQPSASAIAVNRILDVNGTQILGHLNANGQVYLINPNGIVFGPGAEVNVGGLVASTLALDAASVPGDAQSLSGDGAGSVINQGTIHAASGGYVALLGRHVDNNGVISAQLGTVALGAGSAATLKFRGTHLVSMQIDQSVLNSVADNGGLIRADGGQVLMSAGAEKALLASVVNNTGVIEARTLDHQAGDIILRGGMVAGTVTLAGTLDASAPDGGNGGAIETSAALVHVADGARVTTRALSGRTGSWLIDPQDFTVAASGGDMTGATLTTGLANNNVQIQSSQGATAGNGDININDVVTWSAHTLTLTAARNVNVNAVMTATGSASLDLEPATTNGLDGAVTGGAVNMGLKAFSAFTGRVDFSGTGVLTMGGQVYVVINSLGSGASDTTAGTLQGIQGGLAGNYALGSNIDASATAGWNSGAGFTPLGNGNQAFTGAFNGLGHTISGLTAIQPTGENIGLFGGAVGGTVTNVGLIADHVNGSLTTGGLIGYMYTETVANSYASGTAYSNVQGSSDFTGGLIGEAISSSITNTYSTGSVTGIADVGGLIGTAESGSITNSRSSANVTANGVLTGTSGVGGLVGQLATVFANSSISSSYSTGSVTDTTQATGAGGLVGYMSGGAGAAFLGIPPTVASISNSYSTSHVTGSSNVGGLAGQSNYGLIQDSYASGSVGSLSASAVGGLVGLAQNSAITHVYATGAVNAPTGVGGLVGVDGGGNTVTGAFWDTVTTGQATSACGTGMTTSQMQQLVNFTTATTANGSVNPAWDFGSTWTIYSGETYPLLQVFLTPLTVSGTVTQTYDGAAFAPTIANLAYSIAPDFSQLFGTVTITGSAVGAKHAGSYSFTPGGLYSDQQGYLIEPFVGGTLTINPAPLTVTGSTASKVYDGTTSASLSGGTLVGVFAGDTVTLAQDGTYASKHAGTGIAVTATDSLGGPSDGDYVLVEPTGLIGTIRPASLSVSGTVVGNKIFNGNSSAPLLDGSLSGVVPGDSVTLVQGGTFASSGVGAGIAVTAADRLSGPSAPDYSLIQPTGLTGTISPATTGNTPGTPGSSGGSGTSAGSSSPLLAAYYASAQVDANFIAPQWGTTPQVVDASPSIKVVATASEPASTDAGDDQNSTSSSTGGGVVINVAMKIGATGTLKIVSGGLRLPVTHIEGNP
jgi:filamentous hemagglutinin family protein